MSTLPPDPANEIVLEPDNYPSVEDEPLGPAELDVKAHWERFLPKLVASLNRQGPDALDMAIRQAWWQTEYQIERALAENPTLSRLQAEALFRQEWCYLPPEATTTPATPPPTTPSPPSDSDR